jgi:hypothetical protein
VEAAHRAIPAHDDWEGVTMIEPCIDRLSERKFKPGVGKGLCITAVAEMLYHYVSISCLDYKVA